MMGMGRGNHSGPLGIDTAEDQELRLLRLLRLLAVRLLALLGSESARPQPGKRTPSILELL
jgi:hypothetical protein